MSVSAAPQAVTTATWNWRSVLTTVGWFLPPMAAALYIAAVTIPGSTLVPWSPAMIDLDVYRRTGSMLLAGQDFYVAEGLPWIYPPFAALLTIPLAVVPLVVAQVGWIALTVVLLMAMLYRLGLSGWVLSLVTTVAVVAAEPVRETLGFGQLGVLLVAAAVLDSMPGRRILPRRVTPEGTWIGLATAEADSRHRRRLSVLRWPPPPRAGRLLHVRGCDRPGRIGAACGDDALLDRAAVR